MFKNNEIVSKNPETMDYYIFIETKDKKRTEEILKLYKDSKIENIIEEETDEPFVDKSVEYIMIKGNKLAKGIASVPDNPKLIKPYLKDFAKIFYKFEPTTIEWKNY